MPECRAGFRIGQGSGGRQGKGEFRGLITSLNMEPPSAGAADAAGGQSSIMRFHSLPDGPGAGQRDRPGGIPSEAALHAG